MKSYMHISALLFCMTALSLVLGFMGVIIGVCAILTVINDPDGLGQQCVLFGLIMLLLAWRSYYCMLKFDAAAFNGEGKKD